MTNIGQPQLMEAYHVVRHYALCNCKHNQLQEKLLEIGFIEEMRTACGNEEVLQIFFHNSLIRENAI